VHLTNPAAMQQYNGLQYIDDHSEARWLAYLLHLGVLPEGYLYPKAERVVRNLLRKRAPLVRQHTANVLCVPNIMARHTGTRFSVTRIQELTKQELQSLLAEEPQVVAVIRSLAVLDCLKHKIKALEQTVSTHLPHISSYEQLLTVAGIGTILAHMIALVTGHIRHFPTVGISASSCRWVGSNKSSHGKCTGTGNNGTPIEREHLGRRRRGADATRMKTRLHLRESIGRRWPCASRRSPKVLVL
jgi:transposase